MRSLFLLKECFEFLQIYPSISVLVQIVQQLFLPRFGKVAEIDINIILQGWGLAAAAIDKTN